MPDAFHYFLVLSLGHLVGNAAIIVELGRKKLASGNIGMQISLGCFTYKMTKGQHKEVMEGIKQSIEEALDEMIASEDYSFTKIEPNADFTKFKVTTTSSELNLAESISVLAFYMYGGMYNIFNGTEVENIAVDFINEATGQIINSANSRDMGE